MMSSDEERHLFELYGWTQDLVKRRWTSPPHYNRGSGEVRVYLTTDEVVEHSQTSKGEQRLRQFILRWGRPMMEKGWGSPMHIVGCVLQAAFGRNHLALMLFWGPMTLEPQTYEQMAYRRGNKLARTIGLN